MTGHSFMTASNVPIVRPAVNIPSPVFPQRSKQGFLRTIAVKYQMRYDLVSLPGVKFDFSYCQEIIKICCRSHLIPSASVYNGFLVAAVFQPDT
jgi:hypothetical protein